MSAGVIPVADLAVRIMTAGVEPTTRAMQQVEKQGQAVGKAMGKTSETTQSLIYSFNGLAASALGINPSFGTLFANLAPFMLSGAVTAGVLVGLTVLGRAYRALGGDAKKAAKEAAEAAADFKKSVDAMVNAGRGGDIVSELRKIDEGTPAGSFRDGIGGVREERARVAARIRTLEREAMARDGLVRGGGGTAGASFTLLANDPELSKLREKLNAFDKLLAELQTKRSILYGALMDPTNAAARGVPGIPAVDVEARSPNARDPKARAPRGPHGAAIFRDAANPVDDAFRAAQAAAAGRAMDPKAQLESVYGARAGIGPIDVESVLGDLQKALGVFAEFERAAGERMDEMRGNLADQMAASFGTALGDGIQRAVQSGSIGEGFKALTGSLLGGFGGAMRAFGEKALMASIQMEIIKSSLAKFLPGGAIAASIAMIGIGAAMQGAAQASFGGRGGGGFGGGFGGAMAGGSYGAGLGAGGIIDRGVIAGALGPSIGAGAFGAVPTNAAARAVGDVTNVFLIGEDDPRAQRALVSMVNKGVRERNLKLETGTGGR